MDEKVSSTVVSDVNPRFAMYAQCLVLMKRLVIARKRILLENARSVMEAIVDVKSLKL